MRGKKGTLFSSPSVDFQMGDGRIQLRLDLGAVQELHGGHGAGSRKSFQRDATGGKEASAEGLAGAGAAVPPRGP